jgi:peptidoglycan/xylan/chitin deacetylase (PgdA/CDA1 family)
MSWQPTRDLVGYGPNPPDPKWPGGARVAVNFVVNYEEGSEPSMQDGEGYTETGLTESSTSAVGLKGRDLAGESMFEFGSRVGFWRIMRAFQERGLPLTVFGCALWNAIRSQPRPSRTPASTSAATAGAGCATSSSARPRNASTSPRRWRR